MRRYLSPAGDFPPASPARRLLAMTYDLLLCTALLLITTLGYTVIAMAATGEPTLRQQADAGALDNSTVLTWLLGGVLLTFFTLFWCRAGQTLGMQVWGIRVQNADGSALGIRQVLWRFALSIASWSCLGMGFAWMLVDRQKRCWHDLGARTLIVRLPKRR